MDDQRLRVLIVDDTVVYRRILSEVVEAMDDVVLVGTAPHGRLALAKLEQTPGGPGAAGRGDARDGRAARPCRRSAGATPPPAWS